MRAPIGDTYNVCAGHPSRINEYAREKNPLCADYAQTMRGMVSNDLSASHRPQPSISTIKTMENY